VPRCAGHLGDVRRRAVICIGPICAYPYITPRTRGLLAAIESYGPKSRWPVEVHLLPYRHVPDFAATSSAERELSCAYARVQCWFDPPLQVQMSTRVPLAVPAPVTSRHSPDPTPVMVPLLLRVHCWLVPPLQSQMSTLLPGEVAAPATSRHLLP
jgi:hypothetical protein